MNNIRGFKPTLAIITRLREEGDYDASLAKVESALKLWPGNPYLLTLWAGLVQLQEKSKYGLDEAKQALHQAVELDKGSSASAIELGYFLDNVEDNPHAAAKAYAEGVAAARQLLIEGLIGQAKVFRQLEKREEFRRCLLEVLHLTRFDPHAKKSKVDDFGADIIFESPTGHFYDLQLKGPYAEQIQELLSESVTEPSV